MMSLSLALVFVSLLGCSSKPAYFRDELPAMAESERLAVMPLMNFSQDDRAPEIIAGQLTVVLLENVRFTVVDPGAVDEVVRKERLRFTDRLDLETLGTVGRDLGVRFVMVGTINEFGSLPSGSEPIPVVSLSLRIVSCDDGRIVWAASHSRRGDDNETIFGWGKVGTVEQLAAETVEEITKSLRPK